MRKYNKMLKYNQVRRLLLHYKRLGGLTSDRGIDKRCETCGLSDRSGHVRGAIAAIEVILKGYLGPRVKPIKNTPLNYNEPLKDLLHEQPIN